MESQLRWRLLFVWISISLCIGMLITGITGCRRSNATATRLAEAGVQVMDNLAAYYDSLARDTLDDWEMSTLRYGIEGFPSDPIIQKRRMIFRERLQSLEARAHLARTASSAYKALQDLASYNAAGEMSAAAADLGNAVAALPVLPQSGVSPTALFSLVGAELAAARQSRDIKRGVKALSDFTCAMAELFNKEAPFYKAMEENRTWNAKMLSKTLLEKKLVVPQPMISQIIHLLGLTWAEDGKPVENSDLIKGLSEIAYTHAVLLEQAAVVATNYTCESLQLLAVNDNSYVAKGTADTIQILNSVQRAKCYLAKVSKLRYD